MKRSRFSEEQIIAILKEQESGMATADVCRKHGISSATRLQSILASIVDVLPKMMMVIIFGSGLLIIIQVITGDLGAWTHLICGIYGVFLVLILLKLFATIKAVQETDALNGPIEQVRPLTRDAMIVHHYGLALALLMIPLFGAVCY